MLSIINPKTQHPPALSPFPKQTVEMMMMRSRSRLFHLICTTTRNNKNRSGWHNHQDRWISYTSSLRSDSWMDKIKGVFTGPKEKPAHDSASQPSISTDSFTLPQFADGLKNAKRLGTFKQYMVGRSSEATFADAFEKQEAILRYLGNLDPSGEKLQSYQKEEAAKHCNCTIADVENVLAKFTWAKEAQKKMEKLKDEGKPLPTSMAEVQKLMGSTPMDVAQSNLAKSGKISRNALCPCGSKKRYKRCCGKD